MGQPGYLEMKRLALLATRITKTKKDVVVVRVMRRKKLNKGVRKIQSPINIGHASIHRFVNMMSISTIAMLGKASSNSF